MHLKLDARICVTDGVAVLVIGIAVTSILYAVTADPVRSPIIGFFYGVMFTAGYGLIRRWGARKLSVFPVFQQRLLKAVVYTIGFSAVYLAGIVLQTLLLIPGHTLPSIIKDRIWSGLVYLIALPFSQELVKPWMDVETRSIVVTFFTVLFLIAIAGIVISLVEVQWQEAKQRRMLDEAELRALRSQMAPHFLFNTLNTIAAMIGKDAGRAEDLVLKLSAMLRYIFQHSGDQHVALAEELEFTRQYIALLEARFDHNLNISWRTIVTKKDIRVPVLLLQPLIENAVHHGRTSTDRPLTVVVDIVETDRVVTITVADNGRGMSALRAADLPVPGHALANIADRLTLVFRRTGLLTIHSQPEVGTTVTVAIPK